MNLYIVMLYIIYMLQTIMTGPDRPRTAGRTYLMAGVMAPQTKTYSVGSELRRKMPVRLTLLRECRGALDTVRAVVHADCCRVRSLCPKRANDIARIVLRCTCVGAAENYSSIRILSTTKCALMTMTVMVMVVRRRRRRRRRLINIIHQL